VLYPPFPSRCLGFNCGADALCCYDGVPLSRSPVLYWHTISSSAFGVWITNRALCHAAAPNEEYPHSRDRASGLSPLVAHPAIYGVVVRLASTTVLGRRTTGYPRAALRRLSFSCATIV
jgi:hypothetical protein